MPAVTQRQKDILREILDKQEALAEQRTEIKEAIELLAEELGMKPVAVNRMVALVRKEQKSRGSLADEQQLIELALEASA